MRNIGVKIDNTAPSASGLLTAADDNQRFIELENAVLTTGITLDGANGPNTDLFMLAQAMGRYSSGGVWFTDGGAANAYVLSPVNSFIAPKAYFDGMEVEFIAANTSTGASTINVNGLGAKDLVGFDGAAAGANTVSGRVSARYIQASDQFVIAPWVRPTGIVPFYGNGEPTAAPTADQSNYYIDLDTGITYSWNGTGWTTTRFFMKTKSLTANSTFSINPAGITLANVTNYDATTMFDPDGCFDPVTGVYTAQISAAHVFHALLHTNTGAGTGGEWNSYVRIVRNQGLPSEEFFEFSIAESTGTLNRYNFLAEHIFLDKGDTIRMVAGGNNGNGQGTTTVRINAATSRFSGGAII